MRTHVTEAEALQLPTVESMNAEDFTFALRALDGEVTPELCASRFVRRDTLEKIAGVLEMPNEPPEALFSTLDAVVKEDLEAQAATAPDELNWLRENQAFFFKRAKTLLGWTYGSQALCDIGRVRTVARTLETDAEILAPAIALNFARLGAVTYLIGLVKELPEGPQRDSASSKVNMCLVPQVVQANRDANDRTVRQVASARRAQLN